MTLHSSDYAFFVAHAAPDLGSARALRDALGADKTFLAADVVAPGDSWPDVVADAVRTAPVTVVLLSGHVSDSLYLREEVIFAIEAYRADSHRRRVVPVVLDARVYGAVDMPYGLRSLQAVMLSGDPDWRWLASELEMLRHRLTDGGPPEPGGPGSPRDTPREVAHVLHGYPKGPCVPMHMIPRSLVLAIAILVGNPTRMGIAVAEAAALRREADPRDATATVVEPHDLPAATVPPSEYWWKVFTEAALHGPRMVAALLITIDHSRMPQPARLDRDRLLHELETIS